VLRIRARTELRVLREYYRKLSELVGLADGPLDAHATQVSKWSVAQQACHIFLVNGAAFRNIRKLCAGEKEAEGPARGLTWTGLLVLACRWIPRGRGRAPQAVVPPAEVSRDRLAELLEESRRELEEIGALSGAMGHRKGRIRHFIFGELDALQWLRFARIHTRHHLKIIRDIQRRMPLERGEAAP